MRIDGVWGIKSCKIEVSARIKTGGGGGKVLRTSCVTSRKQMSDNKWMEQNRREFQGEGIVCVVDHL